jgi:hypothetical protein
MSASLKGLSNKMGLTPYVVSARDYITKNSTEMIHTLKKSTGSYRKQTTERVATIKSFAVDRVRDLRSSKSVVGFFQIVLGILVTLFQLLMEFVAQSRKRVMSMSKSVYVRVVVSMKALFANVKERASDLPNTPVAKKVESVSKRVLGDSRHDQAVEFIKTEVYPRVERVILTGIEKTTNNKFMGSFPAESPSRDSSSGRSTDVGLSPMEDMGKNKQKLKKKL